MARLARVVVPGMPHYVTRWRNRRQETFFCDDDYQTCLDLMAPVVRGIYGRGLFLLPDAESCFLDLDRGASDRAGGVAGRWQGPSALCATLQLPREMTRLYVAGAVRFVRDGRNTSPGVSNAGFISSQFLNTLNRSLRADSARKSRKPSGRGSRLDTAGGVTAPPSNA